MIRIKGRDALIWGVRLAIAASLLLWVFSNDDVRRGMWNVHFARPWFLAAALISAALSTLLAAWRWFVCLRALECALPFGTVLRFLIAGNAAGMLSIGPLGVDVVRGALAVKRLPNNKAAIASSIVLDHVCALPAVLALGATLIITMGMMPTLSRATAINAAIIVAVFAVVGTSLEVWRPGLHRQLHASTLARLNVKGALLAAVIAAPVLLSHYAVFWCAAQALALRVNAIGLLGAIVVADTVAALPITIAGIGVREKSFEVLLQRWYGVVPALSVQASLAGFAVLALWAVLGVLCFPITDGGAADSQKPKVHKSADPRTSAST